MFFRIWTFHFAVRTTQVAVEWFKCPRNLVDKERIMRHFVDFHKSFSSPLLFRVQSLAGIIFEKFAIILTLKVQLLF